MFPRSAFRQTETIVAPCFAKARAVAKPMPEFAPVITTILFCTVSYASGLAVPFAPWAGLISRDSPDTLGLQLPRPLDGIDTSISNSRSDLSVMEFTDR